MDHQMTNELDASSFMYFFKKNYILVDDTKLNLLCSLFPGSIDKKVNYMHFLETCELIDPTIAQQYVRKMEKNPDELFAEDFASCVELYCRTQNLPVLQIFDVYDQGNKGFLTFSEFRALAVKVNTEQTYGEIEIEKLFNYVDSNRSEKITKNEFFKVIMSKHYTSWLNNKYSAYTPHFVQIKNALKNHKKRDLKEFFSTDKDVVGFENFNRAASFLEYDRRSDDLFQLMKAFEDEEFPNNVNIAKVLLSHQVTKDARSSRRRLSSPTW
jgi:hypothetical protein